MRVLLAGLLVAGCAAPTEMSEWERQNIERQAPPEENIVPPPYPQRAKLIEFPIADMGGFRFFIDSATLRVDKGGVVRYVLVAQSPAGAQNVSFEGLRCSSAEHRIYATGHSDRTWTMSRSRWQPLTAAPVWDRSLYREYFCPQKVPISDVSEGIRALQDGGHPRFKGTSPQYGL